MQVRPLLRGCVRLALALPAQRRLGLLDGTIDTLLGPRHAAPPLTRTPTPTLALTRTPTLTLTLALTLTLTLTPHPKCRHTSAAAAGEARDIAGADHLHCVALLLLHRHLGALGDAAHGPAGEEEGGEEADSDSDASDDEVAAAALLTLTPTPTLTATPTPPPTPTLILTPTLTLTLTPTRRRPRTGAPCRGTPPRRTSTCACARRCAAARAPRFRCAST